MTDREPVEPQDPNAAAPYYPPPSYPGHPGGENYGTPGYGTPGYGGYDRPAYPPAYPSYSGYPGYPPPPPTSYAHRTLRPGSATTAAVLSFVVAGLLVIAAFVLLASASALNDLESIDSTTGPYPTDGELALNGLLNLAAAGVLIAGGVKLTSRNRTGQLLIYAGAALTSGYGIYWLVRVDAIFDLFWVVLFCSPVITAVCLAASSTTRQWLTRPAEKVPAPPGTPYGPSGSGGAHL